MEVRTKRKRSEIEQHNEDDATMVGNANANLEPNSSPKIPNIQPSTDLIVNQNELLSDEEDEDYKPPSDDEESQKQQTDAKTGGSSLSKRTRANLSFKDISLEELEQFLHETPPSSPPSDKNVVIESAINPIIKEEDGSDEYRRFLHMLQTGELMEDDNDMDYHPPEGAAAFSSFCIPKEEIYDSEEFRNDRAVRVSRQELEILIAEAKKEEVDLTQPKEEVTQVSKKVKGSPSRRNRKKIKKETNSINSKSPIPIRPLFYPTNVSVFSPNSKSAPSVISPAPVFTNEQLLQLKTQMNEHLQLLVQVFLLSRQDHNQSAVISASWDMINQLNHYKDESTLYRHQASKFYETPTVNSEQISNVNAFQSIKKESIWELPALNNLNDLYDFTRKDIQPSLASMQTMVDLFDPLFSPELKIVHPSSVPTTQANRLKFTPAEDNLLVMGLERYGVLNWDLIQKNILLTKTVKQIANRYKNMSSTRAPDNPIKTYKSLKTKLLSREEETILYQGVQMYGYEWDTIARQLLPQYPPSALYERWLQLQRNMAIERPTLTSRLLGSSKSQQKKKPTNRPQINRVFLRDNVSLPQSNHLSVLQKGDQFLDFDRVEICSASSSENSPQISFAENTNSLINSTSSTNFICAPSQSAIAEAENSQSFEQVEFDDSDEEHAPGSDITEFANLNPSSQSQIKSPLEAEHSFKVEWTKEEDRLILTSAKDTLNGSALKWDSLVASGSIKKTIPQITERYNQLIKLFKTQTLPLSSSNQNLTVSAT